MKNLISLVTNLTNKFLSVSISLSFIVAFGGVAEYLSSRTDVEKEVIETEITTNRTPASTPFASDSNFAQVVKNETRPNISSSALGNEESFPTGQDYSDNLMPNISYREPSSEKRDRKTNINSSSFSIPETEPGLIEKGLDVVSKIFSGVVSSTSNSSSPVSSSPVANKKTSSGSVDSLKFTGLESITEITPTTLTLNWTNESDASEYRVYSVNAGIETLLATVNAGLSQYLVTGLTANTLYSFRVKMVTNSDGEILNTSDLTATTDVNAPVFNSSSLPINGEFLRDGITQVISWNTTDPFFAAGPVSLELSINSGLTWSNIATGLSAIGSYNWTVPSINCLSCKVRIVAVNSFGKTTSVASTGNFTIDSTKPTISSFVLANGVNNVGLPNLSVSIRAADTTTNVTHMRFSENPTYSDDNWHAYLEEGHFTLVSFVGGPKTVYAWVKDSAGNINTVAASDGLSLDFGSPPTITIAGPNTGPFAAGDIVPIQWNCASSSGLGSTPVNVKYTDDDGATFKTIAGDQINNETPTSGSYNWILPPGVTTFRLLIECTSLAGVRSSAYSNVFNTPGWSVYIGDPWNGIEEVSAAAADITSHIEKTQVGVGTIASDAKSNVYFTKNNAIMKVDARTGLVTRYAGTLEAGGCTMSTGANLALTTNTFANPLMLGVDSSRRYVFMLSLNCNKIFRIDTTDSSITEWATTPARVGRFFLTKNSKLFYIADNYRVYMQDLNIPNTASINIYGNGTQTATLHTAGDDARTLPLLCNTVIVGGPCAPDHFLIANDDGSKVWMAGYQQPANTVRLDLHPDGHYIVGNPNVASATSSSFKQWCVPIEFSTMGLCRGRHLSRNIWLFDYNSETWTLADTYEDGTASLPMMFLHSTPTNILIFASTNSISYASIGTVNNWSFNKFAGQPLSTYGNGTNPRLVAFDAPRDVKYNSATQTLWVRNQLEHDRRIDLSTNPATTSTLTGVSGGNILMGMKPDGLRMAVRSSCARNSIASLIFDPVLNSYTNGGNFLAGPCNNTGIRNPASDTNATNGDARIIMHQESAPIYHSNGLVYFAKQANEGGGVTRSIVYSSDKLVLKRIAGKDVASNYVMTDHGGPASDATLFDVYQMIEITNGAHAGDIFIWDGRRIRLITLTSEAPAPNIYDIHDLATVPGNSSIIPIDLIYDSSTECSSAIGTGTFYYSTSSQVRKIFTNCGDSSVADTAIDFSGTSFTGSPRITKFPGGLLVLQPHKKRVLVVP